MSDSKLIGVCGALLLSVASAYGQLGNGSGVPGSWGGRGLSMPSGSLRNSPLAHPSPSLTPHEVLHPRGSLSSAQVRQPQGSLWRPRSGGNAVSERPLSLGSGRASSGIPSRQAAIALERKLANVAAGKGWEDYLGLRELRQISDFPVDEQQRRQLALIVQRFDSVAVDRKYQRVHSLPEFHSMRRVLRDHLQASDQQLAVDLRVSFARLERDLRSHTNGHAWAAYLALPDAWHSTQPAGDQVAVRKLLTRFQNVDSDPAYALIASLKSFQPAYRSLSRFIATSGQKQVRGASRQRVEDSNISRKVKVTSPNHEGAKPPAADRNPAR